MSDIEEFLEHFGVKGMKWGQRKAAESGASSQPTKKEAKADAKWLMKNNTLTVYFKVHNRAAYLANVHDVERINKMPKYRNADFRRDSPLRREYYNEHEVAFNRRMQQAADEIIGPSPSGRQRVLITDAGEIHLVDIEHDNLSGKFVLVFDSTGHISEFKFVEDSMEQSDIEEFLEHVGVKGMRWGFRKTQHKESHDSKSVKKHRGKPAHALTNKQLKDLNARMNLEQQYNRMNPTKVKRGHDKVKEALAIAAIANTVIAFARSPAGRHIINLGRRAAGQEEVPVLGPNNPLHL